MQCHLVQRRETSYVQKKIHEILAFKLPFSYFPWLYINIQIILIKVIL